MYPTANYQPRVAPGLRASLRVSTKFLAFPARQLHRQNSDETSEGSDEAAERLSFSDDDLVDIDPEERSAAAAVCSPPVSARSPVSPFESKYLAGRCNILSNNCLQRIYFL